MSPPSTYMLARARWEVMWVVKGPRIIVKEFEDNLAEALELYDKARKAGKKMVTLRCANVGFPPPDKYADHEPIYKTRRRKGKQRRVLKNGEPVIIGYELIEPRVYQERMRHLNVLKGIWWCPYCMKLRSFDHRIGFVSDLSDTVVEADGYYCPLCDIPHWNHKVQEYNPLAREIGFRAEMKRQRGGRSKSGKRRRNRR